MGIDIKNEKIYEIINTIKHLNDKFDDVKPFTDETGLVLFGKEPMTDEEINIFKKSYKDKIPPKLNFEKEKRKYRYFYCKIWESNKPILYFLLLNPSTTNIDHMDPTVNNCYELASKKYRSRYGGFAVVNLFALRSPKTEILNTIRKSNKFDFSTNLEFLEKLFKDGDIEIVIAWGLDKKYSAEKETVKGFHQQVCVNLQKL